MGKGHILYSNKFFWLIHKKWKKPAYKDLNMFVLYLYCYEFRKSVVKFVNLYGILVICYCGVLLLLFLFLFAFSESFWTLVDWHIGGGWVYNWASEICWWKGDAAVKQSSQCCWEICCPCCGEVASYLLYGLLMYFFWIVFCCT